MEASACGIPVATIKHPQNAATDLITDGKNGFLCEFNEEDMAEKIMLALKKSQDMSSDCLAYARENSWEREVDAVEGVYKSALEKGK